MGSNILYYIGIGMVLYCNTGDLVLYWYCIACIASIVHACRKALFLHYDVQKLSLIIRGDASEYHYIDDIISEWVKHILQFKIIQTI